MEMTDRVRKLVSKIRIQLEEVAINSIQTPILWHDIDIIQDELLKSTWCLEKSFPIVLIKGVYEYDFKEHRSLLIKSVEPSWNGKLEFVSLIEFSKLKGGTSDGGMFPSSQSALFSGTSNAICTIFDNKLLVYPTPQNDEEQQIVLRGYQTSVINPIDAETDPEVPEWCDNALIWGVVSRYIPNFNPLYQEEKRLILVNSHGGHHLYHKRMVQTW